MPRRPSLPTKSTRTKQNRHSGLLDNRAVADALISLAGMVGLPVENQAGAEVGKVADVVARWDGGRTRPRPGWSCGSVVGPRTCRSPRCRDRVGQGALRSARLDLRDFQRRTGEVVLGRDVARPPARRRRRRAGRAGARPLPRPGRASWRLVGVDVGIESLLRRLGPARRRNRATPERVLDWAAVQPFGSANPRRAAPRPPQPGAHAAASLGGRRPARGARSGRAPGAARRPRARGSPPTRSRRCEPEELEQLLRDAPWPQAAALLVADGARRGGRRAA